MLDVTRIRARFPALQDGYAYFDRAAGTQVPEPVIHPITEAYRHGIGNVGSAYPASARTEAIVRACRAAVADLVGARPEGVSLGPNMPTLTGRREHSALDPRGGSTRSAVRWAEVDLDTGELPVEQYDELLTERTRLVAMPAASNVLGTCPDVAAISAKAHADGALTYVDGVVARQAVARPDRVPHRFETGTSAFAAATPTRECC